MAAGSSVCTRSAARRSPTSARTCRYKDSDSTPRRTRRNHGCPCRHQRLRTNRSRSVPGRFESGADIEWVDINDVAEPAMLAHLLKYDTVYGPFAGTVEAADDGLVVEGNRIATPM